MSDNNSSLPEEVQAFIERVTGKMRCGRRVREDVRRELRAHFEDALDGTPDAMLPARISALLAEFGEPRLLGMLIGRAKKRCRSPLLRVAGALVKFVAAAVAGLVVVALVRGEIAERRYQQGVAALERGGLLSSPSQLRAPRPVDTVYYSGPPEESATAFLLSMREQPESLFRTCPEAFEKLQAAHGRAADTLPRIRELVAPLAPFLEKARSAATLPPTPMPAIITLMHLNDPSRESLDVGLPCVGFMHCLLLASWAQYSDGRVDEAIETCELVLRLVEHLRDMPQFLSQLIAMSAERGVFQLFGWMHEPTLFSDETLALLVPYACRGAYERAGVRQTLTADSFRARRSFHAGVRDMLEEPWSSAQPFRQRALNWYITHLYFTPLCRFLSSPDKLAFCEQHQKISECFLGPYYAIQDRLREVPTRGQIPRTRILTRMLAGVELEAVAREQAICEAYAALFRTAADVERYKRVNGNYPANLVELPPSSFPGSAIDPLSGEPLRYALTRDSFTLQSVGYEYNDSNGNRARSAIVWGE